MVDEEVISRLNGLCEFSDDQFAAMATYLNVAGKALLTAERELEYKHLEVALLPDPNSDDMQATFQEYCQFSNSYAYIFRSSFFVHIHGFFGGHAFSILYAHQSFV